MATEKPGSQEQGSVESARRPHSEAAETSEVMRLETDIFFVRHGEAERLPGSDSDPSIDARRSLTAQGQGEVDSAGVQIGDEILLKPGDVVFFRHSPLDRSAQTARRVRAKFLERQAERGAVNIYAPDTEVSTRSAFVFPPETEGDTYTKAKERNKREKPPVPVGEQWVRDPQTLDADMVAAGLRGGRIGAEINRAQKEEYQTALSTIAGAAARFHERWARQGEANRSETPPHMVVIIGSHGSVAEPWVLEAVKGYEAAHHVHVPLGLDYGGNLRIHLPANPKENATLTINSHTIPLSPELLNRALGSFKKNPVHKK